MNPYGHYKIVKAAGLFTDANVDGLQGLRALLGAGAGGLLGAGVGGLGGLLKETFFTDPDKAQYLRRALQAGTIGGLTGAGLGAAVGASNKAREFQAGLEDRAMSAISDYSYLADDLRKKLLLTIAKDTQKMMDATETPFGLKPKIDIKKLEDDLYPERPEFADGTSTR